VDTVDERHRHRYEVNPIYIEEFEKAGMKFVGRSDDNQRMEIIELENHPYFVGVQYHPEYISRPLKPSAPYLGLIWVNNLFIFRLFFTLFLFFYLGCLW
jgi:CTP synthase